MSSCIFSSNSSSRGKKAASHKSRSSRRPLCGLAALAIVGWLANSSYAFEIVAIEEYWELTLGQPDGDSSSPQVSMVMSPTGNLDGQYFVFTLNHHTVPEWGAGGTQVQVWNGEESVDYRAGSQEGSLSHNAEVVRWVQRTELVDGKIHFEVVNGESRTWGAFGNAGDLAIIADSELTNLNDYRPAISLEQSGVGFGGNRVRSLVLTKLRWIDSNENAYELNAPIDVDTDLDP